MSQYASSPGWTASAQPPSARRPRRALEIAGIVLVLIHFWPLALAYLAWKLMGYPKRDEMRAFAERQFGGLFSGFSRPVSGYRRTGNRAFEDYRKGELARLDEERRRLDEESRAFGDFVDELTRAKDREEFDAFMARRRD